jgi:hypothetical protein
MEAETASLFLPQANRRKNTYAWTHSQIQKDGVYIHADPRVFLPVWIEACGH